ncbi:MULTISPECIES: cellulose biosynthesis cyclic di-GMP-binding regulatory protein BcsB [unclassified Agrobacterium]|uniref:cellulose biosynthesis cyclic di-GMP-binding regulatory protein BcsB n=1 Tax=unclassified Agrobacterium TaxID=2632611 RepID=UPI00244C2DFF|nr:MULTISPECIES: cellulose biosynthesis cyclic di-GMP-binding regulatory protein BcsB [unclassified Agrobacterium]MDH0616342.1 cellulose biosynthesis cyclic di-GMP-binding regulatory protein BcsB [Agrobacterium sp. GD03872]MDH0698913.1 cellulose biosynthesis cyclic di-GMP-binding regulatory protein BcsB [Agrobacterium sp. GD03871]MDH1061572.1 cellulose biosynthesis cyclic di-GMP-binding regulatory protein BcsB [Agrobacterium sp. GD03992]MDH2213099.1 cellulose biosynthesis cyclic di-GMP-binding 
MSGRKPIRGPLAALILGGVATGAMAQSSPFDMSPERPAQTAPAPLPPPTTPPAAPRQQPPAQMQDQPPPQPSVPPPFAVQPPPQRPAVPLPPVSVPPRQEGARPVPAQVSRLNADSRRRYILPYEKLSLSGEMDRRQWSIYLTPEQVNAAVSLNIGYQNAVVVAPESSNFQVSLNNVALDAARIEAPDSEGNVSLKIPPGILQVGSNVVRLGVQQRHRTDCTIQSTYDLWTDIDPANTYIGFNADVAGSFANIDDIQATGPDGKAMTSIEIVAPALGNPAFADSLLRLSQALALRTQMPNQTIRFVAAPSSERKAGTLTVLVGTAREIAGMAGTLPPEASAGAFAGFGVAAPGGLSPLFVSGPTPQAVQAAIETLFSSISRTPGALRTNFSTRSWQSPDVPLVMSDRRIALSELGLESTEFSGRRFRNEFYVGMPADFYASAYGEASLLLDAAYSSQVLPGSHVDIYVNDQIASTVPISNNGGGIFRHLPINVTMRHFKPGPNRVTIEAVLMTAQDQACAPGAPASTTPRFALFDTSEFHIPDYAQIGRKPDLAALAGAGQPYRAGGAPVALSLDRFDTDTMSAAATLVSRLASVAGHPIDIETVASPLVIGDRDALFVGTISQFPQALISQFNLVASSQISWKMGAAVQPAAQSSETLFNDWRERVDGGVWEGQVSSFEEWMKRNFDLSSDTLRFLPAAEQPYAPPGNVSFMLAQGLSPSGEGVWTLATAPTSAELFDGMAAMTRENRWRGVTGRVAAYDTAAEKLETLEVERPYFYVTRAFSFSNWRLVAANWLSSNVLSYSLAFIGFVSLLGLVTFAMLRMMGRHR